jgi:hypothetical protein
MCTLLSEINIFFFSEQNLIFFLGGGVHISMLIFYKPNKDTWNQCSSSYSTVMVYDDTALHWQYTRLDAAQYKS